MKVGYFDIYRHPECLNSFCMLFTRIKEIEQISVFTKEEFALELKKDFPQINWYIKTSEKTAEFMKKYAEFINNQDILFFGTMVLFDDLNSFTKFDFKPVTVLRIHNFTMWFNKVKSIYWKGFLTNFYNSMALLIKYLILKGNIFKVAKFLKKMDYYMFYNDVVEEYALKIKPELKKKTFPSLYFNFPYEMDLARHNNTNIVITISGYIAVNRRDYNLIYRVLKNIKPKLEKKLTVKLLGVPVKRAGHKIATKIKSLSGDNLKIITFNKRPSQQVFYQEMINSTILLSPIVINTHGFLYKAVYGKTKTSGVEDDVIRYQRPVIMPEKYNPSKHTAPFVYKYKDSEDLGNLILKIATGEIVIPSRVEIYEKIMSDKFFSPEFIMKIIKEKVNSAKLE